MNLGLIQLAQPAKIINQYRCYPIALTPPLRYNDAMRRLNTILLLLIIWTGLTQALYDTPSNYYDSAAGKSGPELKSALTGIISNHTARSYADARTILQTLDAVYPK